MLLERPERADDQESTKVELEIRRERNGRRSETMKAKAAAKRAELLSPSPIALDEADAASGGRITQWINDQALHQQKPRRTIKDGAGFRGNDHDGCIYPHQ
jgi:hypothetical protein